MMEPLVAAVPILIPDLPETVPGHRDGLDKPWGVPASVGHLT
jgi:hypothetical protein